MAIQTQQSFSGFVASDPQLSRTENGDARLLSLIHISEPTRRHHVSRMPYSA